MAVLVMVLNTVNTSGEFIFNKLLVAHAAQTVAAGTSGGLNEGDVIGVFKGEFFASVNLLGFLIQLLLVSRIFKYLGVRGALFIPPVIGLLSYGALAALPLLGVVRFTKTIENATDYSLQNTSRQALFLPTSREAKYKAKQAIDAFFVRAGDLLQAAVVFIGTSLAFLPQHFAMLNLVFVAVWLALVVAIAREHKKLVPTEVAEEAA